ncbi:DNA mismatch repair endonuclease MutL [Luteitalea sp.]|uniref:DNA mismatch repair endonuclease MutL n=1 Tax=Luteitalea sp. TaxID=2004800 RepID=UPI0025B8B11D|nr:DNA mismatch repair endonuclease MutL [Luteitalea sp.]
MKIQVLPAALANQIAAGEVVERPASVVKELVENALDAGARRVAVAIEQGGRALIRVEDDGEGMSPEDARLAVHRHATSKIRVAADLDGIRTLGFRGEALPSIASVSRFSLRTRARGSLTGVELRIDGGEMVGIHDIGAPEGTTIEVRDLFYNLPARRKFLKADSAEAAQVSRLMTQLALGAPTVGFQLSSGGRKLLDCPPAGEVAERFYQIYQARPDLVEVRREGGGLRVHGYIAPLAEQGPRRGPQNIYVNGRIVRDKTIAHAIQAAYAVATVKERSPEVHLFIEMPPERVDVNVHPTKAEVRFLEQGLVHEVLRRALGDALGAGPSPELRLQAPVAPIALPAMPMLPGVLRPDPSLHQASWRPVGSSSSPELPGRAELVGSSAGEGPPGLGGPPRGGVLNADEALAAWEVAAALGGQARPVTDDAILPMKPLGQFRHTYILAVDQDGIAIIDQHVAHERVLYERIYERLTSGRLQSQRMLTPLVFELDASQVAGIEAHMADLERLGFEVAPFGGKSVRVSAMPSLIGVQDVEPTLRALGQDLEGFDRAGRVDDVLKHIAATMACHAAVKANDPLPLEKMQFILDELHATAYSTVCPHGRPVMLRITRREIEKSFQRI